MKDQLKVYLCWCIMEDDSEHGRAIIAHNEDEARRFAIIAWPFVKGVTLSEATETTKAWAGALPDMYEKQQAILGV